MESWRNATLSTTPPDGWIRTVREALGMTTVAYAKRLGMTDSGVRRIEKSEINETITLSTLRKMAEALDCEVKTTLEGSKEIVSKDLNFQLYSFKNENIKIFQYDLDSSTKLQIRYSVSYDPLLGESFINAMLELLVHKGGNGLSISSSTSAISARIDNRIIFNLKYIFDDRSDSLDYQLSKSIGRINSFLECSIL